jgi:ribosomal protein L28
MRCQICDKTSMMGGLRKKLRGKNNPTANKWKRANIQKTQIEGEQIQLCTRCLRTIAKKSKA